MNFEQVKLTCAMLLLLWRSQVCDLCWHIRAYMICEVISAAKVIHD